MKSSRKRGPVVISDGDSYNDLQPLQKNPIRQALLVPTGNSRRHSSATFVVVLL